MQRTFRLIWGLLTLASCGWLIYGVAATGNAVGQVVTQPTPTTVVIKNAQGTAVATSDPQLIQGAQALGATIGGGIGLTLFLCTGLPGLVVFGFLYWRNGVAMRRAKEHAETIEALKTRAN